MARLFENSRIFWIFLAFALKAPVAQASKPMVAAGESHACALNSVGSVFCWGSNVSGQLGNNSTVASYSPVQVQGLSSGMVAIAAGDGYHNCALSNTGGVLCWGANSVGQLGNNSTIDSPVPVPVTGLSSGVASIAVGGSHTCALTTTGAVWCWGWNNYGQLGSGNTIGGAGVNSYVPVQVSGLTSGVVAIAAGQAHSCALTNIGAVKCWGSNQYGQLGTNTSANSAVPVQPLGLTSGITGIDVAGVQSFALTTGGVLWNWGGVAGVYSYPLPVAPTGFPTNIAEFSIGSLHACLIVSSGAAQCWGDNQVGELGNGSTAFFLTTPVSVSGLTSGVMTVAASRTLASSLSSFAISSLGDVYGWGDNRSGQLGIGNIATIESTTPVRVLGVGGIGVLNLGIAPRFDLNDDGKADLLFQNINGYVYALNMNGSAVASEGGLGSMPAGYKLIGRGDLDGDGRADLVWQHTSGYIWIWLTNGVSIKAQGGFGSLDTTSWKIVGIADLDGDGKDDLIYQHISGYLYALHMNGTTIKNEGGLGSMPSGWSLAGFADLNSDGRADLLWQHSSGYIWMWLMNGNTIVSQGGFGSLDTTNWKIAGLADLDADGKADIIYQHTSGYIYALHMNGTSKQSESGVGQMPPGWRLAAEEDINGDGKTDFIWQHTSGYLWFWLMNGSAIGSQAGMGSLSPTNWNLLAN